MDTVTGIFILLDIVFPATERLSCIRGRSPISVFAGVESFVFSTLPMARDAVVPFIFSPESRLFGTVTFPVSVRKVIFSPFAVPCSVVKGNSSA